MKQVGLHKVVDKFHTQSAVLYTLSSKSTEPIKITQGAL